MPRSFPIVSFLIVISLTLIAPGQQPPAGRPQTPRQALTEMVNGGAEGITKHLTVEVQELLAKSNNKAALGVLTGFSSMKPDKNLQAFDSGPVLFAYTEPAQHTKFEVRVENDDMAGDQDDLQLSLHQLRDGQEQETDFGLMSSRVTVSLKQQKGVWRLSNISVGVDLAVGSPEFFKKTLMRDGNNSGTHMGLVASAGGASVKEAAPAPSMPVEQVVMMLGYAENTFANQHPETGFTCSLTALAETNQIMGVDQQVATGVYNGYRFNLSGCEGKPAASFQLTAEPVAAAAGAKAFCTDATHNVRVSEDGKGSSCLAFGKVNNRAFDGGAVNFYSADEVVVHNKPEK
ncbi:MAG TPA: hypothetical protein VFL42_07790 [Terriglobales bacterium]|nr:hypothetical protein [Terriglobales bacterium]